MAYSFGLIMIFGGYHIKVNIFGGYHIKVNSVAYSFGLIMIFGGYHIFVESTVQDTELTNIEFYTKYFHFTDEVPVYRWKKRISKQNISKVLVSQWQVTEPKKIDRGTRQLQNAWFPYDRCRSFTVAGIVSKLFSASSDHMETKFSFLLAITNDPSDCQRSLG